MTIFYDQSDKQIITHSKISRQNEDGCDDNITIGEWYPAWLFDVEALTSQLVFTNRLLCFLFTMLELALKVTLSQAQE